MIGDAVEAPKQKTQKLPMKMRQIYVPTQAKQMSEPKMNLQVNAIEEHKENHVDEPRITLN